MAAIHSSVEPVQRTRQQADPRNAPRDAPSDPSRRDDAGWLKAHGLSLVLVAIFLLFLAGQALAGQHAYNADAVQHGGSPVGLARYLTTAHFGEAVFENWESEFLQMGAYVLLTVWLFQRGSSESKPLEGDDAVDAAPEDHRDDPHAPWPVRHGSAPVLWLYRNSLSIAFFALFLGSWLAHAATGAREYSAEQVEHGQAAVSTWEFVHRSEFWFQSFQNWQSEFLAVASIVVFSVYLRQQGSSESKPVHAPHHHTGAD